MNNQKKEALHAKLRRLETIASQLELADGICFSLEDLNDAYIDAKVEDLKQKMDALADRLRFAKSQDTYLRMYHQLEDYEQAIYLLEKKHSRTYQKAKRLSQKEKTGD